MKLFLIFKNQQYQLFLSNFQSKSFQLLLSQIKNKFKLVDSNVRLSFKTQSSTFRQINTEQKYLQFTKQVKQVCVNSIDSNLQIKCLVQIIDINGNNRSQNQQAFQALKLQQKSSIHIMQQQDLDDQQNDHQGYQISQQLQNGDFQQFQEKIQDLLLNLESRKKQMRQFCQQIYATEQGRQSPQNVSEIDFEYYNDHNQVQNDKEQKIKEDNLNLSNKKIDSIQGVDQIYESKLLQQSLKKLQQSKNIKIQKEILPSNQNKGLPSGDKSETMRSTRQQASKNQNPRSISSYLSVDSSKTLYEGEIKNDENKNSDQFYKGETQNKLQNDDNNPLIQNFQYLYNQENQHVQISLQGPLQRQLQDFQDSQNNIATLQQNQEEKKEISQAIGPPISQEMKNQNQLNQLNLLNQNSEQFSSNLNPIVVESQSNQFFMTIEEYTLSKICITQFYESVIGPI